MQIIGETTPKAQVAFSARQERMVKKNLKFRYEYFEYFVYSQCLPAWLLLVIRLVMGGVCTSVFLYLSITSPYVNFIVTNSTKPDTDNLTTQPPPTFKRHFYLCYLTIWSYLIITLYFISTLVNTVSMYTSTRQSGGEVSDFCLSAGGFKSTENLVQSQSGSGDLMSAPGSTHGQLRQFGLQLQWLLCGVAANAALIVTCGYFFVLYPMIKRLSPGGISPSDLLVHGFNSIFMFIEVSCSGVPVRIVHALYTAIYGLLYTLFSLLYWIPDHTNVIYPILLDWNNAGLTIGMMCLILLVGLPIIQLFWWLVYLTRCFVAAALSSRAGNWRPGLDV